MLKHTLNRSHFSYSISYGLLTILLLFLSGCVSLNTLESGGNAILESISDLNIFTDEEETQFGKAYVAEHDKKTRIYRDPIINNYINSLGHSLVRHCKRKDIQYTFKVVDKKGVNAYAVPGGYIYIHLDLIRLAKTESELAAVLGHEIGHIVGQHSMKRLTQIYGVEILKQLILDEDSDELTKLIVDIIAAGYLFKYSRDNERESDMYGVQNIYDAGFNPEGAAKFFESMRNKQASEPSTLEALISTHPIHSERIMNVRNQIKSLPPKNGLRTDSATFRKIKRRIQ
ncbi:M48 family metalloprotease [Candidatus Poribacteria bacterium]|nr:M48 family metalloprotease [Candidatus Poribacteria bacterium]